MTAEERRKKKSTMIYGNIVENDGKKWENSSDNDITRVKW